MSDHHSQNSRYNDWLICWFRSTDTIIKKKDNIKKDLREKELARKDAIDRRELRNEIKERNTDPV